jgi:3-oxoacyl-[acyl-carrier protein] reductase
MRSGDKVLVCGGSGGIGSAICRALAKADYRPVIGFRSDEKKATTLAAKTNGLALHLDLEDDESIAGAITSLAADSMPLAGVVLAASPPPVIAPFGKIDAVNAARQWRVNVEGPRQLLVGLVRLMRQRQSGVVVAMLTEAMGDENRPAAGKMSDYVIAKFGLVGLMRVIAAEYPWLKTQLVYPGYTETPMLDAFDPRFLDSLRAALPEGKFETPESVAGKVVAAMGA